MRKLKFARCRTPAEETEAAEALRWLERQAVPVGCVVDVAVAFRFLLAVARQHEQLRLSLRELVEAGRRAGLEGTGMWSWRVREGMVGVKE